MIPSAVPIRRRRPRFKREMTSDEETGGPLFPIASNWLLMSRNLAASCYVVAARAEREP